MFADVENEPNTGIDWKAGAKGPMLLVGSTLKVLPSMTLIPGGGGC